MQFKVTPPRIWIGVRVVASVTLLTRASYFLLAIAPLTAATLPYLEQAINKPSDRVHKSLENIANELSVLRQDIDAHLAGALEDPVAGELQRLITHFEAITSRPHRVRLPWTLGSAFLAALLVILAHFLFEVAAPQEIKKSGRHEFTRSAVADFIQAESPEALRLAEEALFVEGGSSFSRKYRKEIERKISSLLSLDSRLATDEIQKLGDELLFELIDYIKFSTLQVSAVSESFKGIADLLKSEHDTRFGEGQSAVKKRQNIAKIERASRLYYDTLAAKRVGLGLSVALTYALALYLYICIAIVQIQAVVSATGLTVSELLTPPFIRW